MQLKHVLAVVDFHTDHDHRAAWRAAQLAWAHEAELCLLTLVDLPDQSPSSRFGASAPPARARADLVHLAASIRDSLGLCPAVILGVGHEAADILDACTQRADLLITPTRSKHLAMIKRAAQQHKTPLLRSRLPATHAHRSAMVIHEADSAPTQALLGAALWMCKPEGIRAVHVHRSGGWPALPGLPGRSRSSSGPANGQTLHQLQSALEQAGLPATQAQVLSTRSTAALAHRQQHSGASLVVRHMRPASPWRRMLRLDPIQQLTEKLDCDVLALPGGFASAKAARATLQYGAAMRDLAVSG